MATKTTVTLYSYTEISEMPTEEAKRRAMETLAIMFSMKGNPTRILKQITNLKFTETGYEYE